MFMPGAILTYEITRFFSFLPDRALDGELQCHNSTTVM